MADFFEEHEQRELIRFGNNAFQELLMRLHRAQTGQPAAAPSQSTSTSSSSRKYHRGALEYEDKYITLLDQHKIYATLEEIADLYINDEKKMVLDFSESRELAVLQRASKTRPMEYVGLRWSLFKSPNRHLAKGQDFCYLEVMKPYIAMNGRRGWAKLSHSIESTICPDFSKTLNVNRGQLYFCGVFFQETSQVGVLNGYFYYNVDRTRIPSILAPAIMKARGKNNAELINHYAKMSRLLVGASKEQAASIAQQLKSEARCGACANRMPKWKSKEKCHFCSAFMCKKCSKIVSKNYRVESMGKKQACFACADEHGVKITRMDDEDSISSRSRTSSTSSREVETPRTVSSSQGSVASSPAHSIHSYKNSRSTSEPIHRQQQLRNIQRHAEILRQRSQTQGVPQRICLDGGSSPTGSHKSEQTRRVPSTRPESFRRRERDPFAAGRPVKAASEQGYSTYSRDPERLAAGFEKEAPQKATTPTPAALDLSYLSNYK